MAESSSETSATGAMRQVVVLGGVFAVLAACGGATGPGSASAFSAVLGNAACPELQGGAMSANFDADARANGTIRAFVTAAGDLATVAARVEAEVAEACERIGQDIGVDASAMRPRQGESRTAAACNAVAGRVDAILQQGATARVRADVTPPQCRVSADVEAQCRAQCNVDVDPGYVVANCAPGQLYGRCEGTCTGTCNGTCNGECRGNCDGQSGSASCAGKCDGTCRGKCTADCEGSCSVQFQEPKCKADIKAPRASGHCDSSCKAHADLTAQCTEPSVSVRATVDAGEIPKLVASLQRNLPVLVKAQIAYGKRIGQDVEVLVRTGAELPKAFGHLSAKAGACVATAANATVRAQAQIRVSVEASASISTRAGASI